MLDSACCCRCILMYMIDTALLKRARLKAGLNQSQLAKAVGKDKSQISRIESGQFASPQLVKAIADHLGVPMDEVVK